MNDETTGRLIQASSGDLALDTVAHLALWHRLQVSEDYARAAEWVCQRARAIGLEQVGIERFPADGTIEYFGNIIPPQWKVKKAELWLTAPFRMKLASYDDLPLSLAMDSTSADVEADLVDIGAGTGDKDYVGGIKGKIALTTGDVGTLYDRAVSKEGAAGLITSWSVPEYDYPNRRPGDFPDQVGWHRIPGKDAKGPAHFAFALSARRAQELRDLLRQGKPVRVHAAVDAELVPGNLEIVSGVIPGSVYPDEEIIVTAHLDHYKPGANDNASGSASILEMARTLRSLIERKELPPPLRTVRFLWIPEYWGTYAWLSKHLDDPVKRIADLNFDMVGENIAKTNSVVSVFYSSDSNPSYLNALMESIVDFVNRFNDDRYPFQPGLSIGSLAGSRNRAAWRVCPFASGSDHDVFNRLGVGATTSCAWPDDFYHSSEDSLDKVDATALHRAIVLGLAAITATAYADSGDAPSLARLSLLYGRKRIGQSEFAAVRSLVGAAKEDFSQADHLASKLIPHVYRRERAAVGSALVFARTAKTRAEVQGTVALLDGDEVSSRKRIDDMARLRAAELGLTRFPETLTEAEKRAARSTPVWQAGKQLFSFEYVKRSLAKDAAARIPEIEAALGEMSRRLRDSGVAELTLYGLNDTPTLYVDGRRSILDIRDAVAVEYTSIPVEALELYFRAFEKAGLMRIREN